MRMTVTLGDESWVLDEDEIDLNDAFLIKKSTGLNMKQFFVGLAEMDPDSLRAMIWFLRYKDGNAIPLAQVNFKLTALNMEDEADPTEGDETPSESGATA